MNTKRKKTKYKTINHKTRVRLISCLALVFFMAILILKTTVFAVPSTVYDLSRNGYYRVTVTNSLSKEKAEYMVNVNILDSAYSDTQYNVSYSVAFVRGKNIFDINWKLDPYTYGDWFADRWYDGVYYPAGSRQYIFHNGITLNKDGYHISTAQPGDTQSVIEGRLGDNGAWWSIDTNATGHTNMGGHGEKHDILRLSYDPDIFTLNFDYNGGSGNWSSVNVRYDTSDNNDVANASPTRAGYTFEGWYTAEGTQVYDKNGKCVNGTGKWKNPAQYPFRILCGRNFFCAIIDTFYVNNCNYIFFLLNIVIQKKSVKNISGKNREYLKRLPAYAILAVAKKEIVSKRCTKRTPEERLLLGGSSHFLTVEHPLG